MIGSRSLIFHYRSFRLLLTGRTVSVLGNAIAPISLAFAVLDMTASVTAVGLVVGVRSVTNVLFLLFGGVIADRFDRQKILVVASLLSAASQGTIACLVLLGSPTILIVAMISAFNGAISAFVFPAAASMTAQVVPVTALKEANSILRIGMSTAAICGVSAGGILSGAWGPGWGLMVDAISFAVAGFFFSRMRPSAIPHGLPRGRSILSDLRVGWVEFVSRDWVWQVVMAFLVINAVENGVAAVLGPAIANVSFGREAWGYVLSAQALGMVFGGFIALRLRTSRSLMYGVIGIAGTSLLPFSLAVTSNVIFIVLGAFVSGVVIQNFSIIWETSLQQNIPGDKLSRIYSYDALGSLAAIPLAQLTVGPISSAVGFGNVLFGATIVIVAAVAFLLSSRAVRTLESSSSVTVAQKPGVETGNSFPDASIIDGR